MLTGSGWLTICVSTYGSIDEWKIGTHIDDSDAATVAYRHSEHDPKPQVLNLESNQPESLGDLLLVVIQFGSADLDYIMATAHSCANSGLCLKQLVVMSIPAAPNAHPFG